MIVKAGTSTYWKTVGAGVDDAKAAFPGCTITFEGPDAETNVTPHNAAVESAVAQQWPAHVSAVTVAGPPAGPLTSNAPRGADVTVWF